LGAQPLCHQRSLSTTDDEFIRLKVAFRMLRNTVGVSRQLLPLRPLYLAGELKCCATSGIGGGPNPAAMRFDHKTGNRQAQTCTLRFCRKQSVKCPVYNLSGPRVVAPHLLSQLCASRRRELRTWTDTDLTVSRG